MSNKIKEHPYLNEKSSIEGENDRRTLDKL